MATENTMGSAIIRLELDPRITDSNQANAVSFHDALWDKCAGPSMYIPCNGEKVFYFPQGHIEQVTSSTIDEPVLHDLAHGSRAFNVPSMVLCEVVQILRKVEADTDAVFADIKLLPVTEQKAPNLDVAASPLPQRTKVRFFCKTLTASDSIHGGLSIPKKDAEQCLPPLDMSVETPSQDLVTQDLHGTVWHFRHVFRGKPKRHLFTAGWGEFVGAKKLVAGDSFIFIRREIGELGVGVRRAHNTLLSPVMSRCSMKLGLNAEASYAISTHNMFSVYYQPKTNHSAYIIPYDRCMTSAPYAVGMRFRMKVEAGEANPAQLRLAGTIVGIEDVDPIMWPGSKWRCLKVQWEGQSTAITVCPDRISPWNIEPDIPVAAYGPMLPLVPRSKRAHGSFSASSSLAGDASFQSGSRPRMGLNDHSLPGFSGSVGGNVGTSRNQSNAHLNSQSSGLHELRCHEPSLVTTPVTLQTCSGTGTCMIFGINFDRSLVAASPSSRMSDQLLHAHHPHVPPQVASSGILQSLQPPDSNGAGNTGKECKNGSMANKTFTKVFKYGCTVGRLVDLRRFDGFDGLIHELDHMFSFEGKLAEPESKWCLIFKDNEGDLNLLHDYTWREFCNVVRKIILYPKDELHKFDPSSL